MMKTIVFGIAVLSATLCACNDSNTSKEAKNAEVHNPEGAPGDNSNQAGKPPVDETVTAYLHLKNALTNDDDKEAAKAGKELHASMLKLDNASLTADQKKIYDELQDDIKEHAEHISDNAGNIKHQREHFDILSKDMYDLVKAVKPTQALYRDHCPMYNDNKGAEWLSEVKEIKNPYYVKEMSACGVVKEEIKP